MTGNRAMMDFFLRPALWLMAIGASVMITTGPAALAAEPTAGSLESALSQMAHSQGRAYVDARSQALALTEASAAELRARLAAAQWTEATWTLEAVAATVQVWRESPELAQRVYDLSGLNPREYLTRRLPQPEVGRELSRLKGAAPILAEVYLKTFATYPFSRAADFPANLSSSRVAELQDMERAALSVGLLMALGRSGHPLAIPLLANVARDQSASQRDRRAATVALGEATAPTNAMDPLRVLNAVAVDATTPAHVRAGALIGLGKASATQPRAATDILQGLLRKETDLEVRRTMVAALALCGASWVEPQTAERRAVRAEVAETLTQALLLPSGEPLERNILEALTVTGIPVTETRLPALRTDPSLSAKARQRVDRAWTRLSHSRLVKP